MKRIIGYLRPYGLAMLTGLIVKFIGTIMDLALPWILAHMIDEVVPTGSRSAIFAWGGAMALCALIALGGNIFANRRACRIARDATLAIRYDLFDRIQSLSSRQLDEMTIPSLISRLTSDSYNINQAIGRIQRIGVRAPILLLGGVTVTMLLDFRLSLVLLATLPLLIAGVALITHHGIPLYTRVQQAVDRMLRTVRDDITGIRVIRALSKGEYEQARFDGDNRNLVREQVRADTIMAATNPLMNLLLNGGLTAVVVTGAFLVNSGLTEPGKIIAFLSYFTIILNAILSINRVFIMLTKATASAQRIDEVLSLPVETADPAAAPEQTDAHIVFDDVCFSYNGLHADLDHISLQVPRGTMLGVIGATGSGKTTLIQLLQRFYRVTSGRILIDGENVNAIDDGRLHTMFGAAFQSDAFFAGSIRENIDLGRGLSDEAISKAARCAQAEKFILARPEGYEYPVHAKALNLSGGQRQRLLIARALAGNPRILILDDSSSALDYRTDAAMRNALRREYPQTTVVLIAQRVSSVRSADQILVLEQGMTAGLGTHEQLLEHCGLYAQISRIQTGADDEGGDANAPA